MIEIIWKLISPFVGALISKHQEKIKKDFAKELLEMKSKFALEFEEKKKKHREDLEKYKSDIEIKKDIIMELNKKKIEACSSTIEILYRTIQWFEGKDYPGQDEDLRNMFKNQFYLPDDIDEKMDFMKESLTDLLKKKEKGEKCTEEFKKKYINDLKKVKKILYDEILSKS